MEEKQPRVLKGYKFKINPSKDQIELFENTFGACRYVWNYMLDVKKNAYLELGTNLNYNDTAKGLVEIKKLEDMEFLSKVNSQSIQQELRKLDVAYSRFFKKQSEFPNFKSRRDKQSFVVPQHFTYEEDGKLYLPKIKLPIEVIQHRKFGNNFEIKFLTISKTKTNKFFVAFCVEEDKIQAKKKSHNKIGIDLGLIDLLTFSTGEKIKNPKIAKQFRKKLEYKYKQLSSKVKGSSNRERARLSVAKTFEKISNIKLDFTHKLTSKIISENQVIVMEDLSVSNMMKNRKLSRSIQEVSWYEIVRQLKYKASWNGRDFIQIDRFFPSSKTCYNDGFVVKHLDLSQRSWTCPKCGEIHDRDINAAKNILKQGLNVLSVNGTLSDVKQKRGEASGRKSKTLKIFDLDTESTNHDAPWSLAKG